MKSIRFLSRPTRQRGLLFAFVSLLALVALSLIGSAPAARKADRATGSSSQAAGVVAVKAADRSVNLAGKSGASVRPISGALDRLLGGKARQTLPSAPNRAASPDLISAGTYPFTSAAGVALEDMSSGTTQLVGPGVDDTASPLTSIGFEYWYDGVRATQFSVNANGLMRLGPTVIGTTFTNSLATTTEAPKIAPYWDDLCTGTDGKVHYKVVGTAPNRKLVVEWLNMKITRNLSCVAPVGNGTFQAWLFEPSHATSPGVIEFVYGALPAAAAADDGYSVGLQSGAATNFASVTTAGPTVSYTTANNAQLDAISAGTAYLVHAQRSGRSDESDLHRM